MIVLIPPQYDAVCMFFMAADEEKIDSQQQASYRYKINSYTENVKY